jgi:predicted DNA-binding transcriptional regulator YafY
MSAFRAQDRKMLASRLLSILMTLQARGRVSARALADEFEVSVRTIYRDIDELSAAGVPVYAEKGRNGGFALLDGYRTRLTGLDRPEAEALLLAGLPGAAAQLGLGEALARTRLKLMAALPEPARDDAERVAQRFHLDPVGWFQAPDEQQVLPELAMAVWSGRTLKLRYDSWKAVVEREVTPLGVVLKAGLWYLVAAVDGAPRTYRVASILDFEVGEPAARPDFDLAAYWAEFRRGYEARMQGLTAKVRASPEALRVLARASHAAALAVQKAGPPDADGWREAEIPIESEQQAVWELLRLGPRLEVLEPAGVRERLKAAAAEVGALYA